MNKHALWAYCIACICTLYLIEGKAEEILIRADEASIADEPDNYVDLGNSQANPLLKKADMLLVKTLLPQARQGEVSKQIALAKLLMQFSIPEYDTAALHWLKTAAQSEEPESLYWLAHCYYEGIGSEVDYDRAFLLFMDLAKQQNTPHSARAQFKLGQMFYYGHGTQKNILVAQQWTVQAARQNIQEAHALVNLFLNQPDLPFSEELLEYATESDDPHALYIKGMYRLYGKQGFEQNIEEGIALLESAANQQFVLAQSELGKIYEKGLFGLENEKKAFDWYLLASQNGDKDAPWCVAQMYYFGNGAEKNYIQSYAWAQIAYLYGKSEAALLRDEISFHLDSEEMNQAHYWSEKYAKYHRIP